MNRELIVEGQDTDGDGQPDWKIKLHIKDPRLWAIVCLAVAVLAGTKMANLW